MHKDKTFSRRLIQWYKQFGRHDLPWQTNPTAYRVWISEIMLQQTQVTTVIPYYQRFMKRFPSLKALATAPQDDVLAHWSGLGYYARARNLHQTAMIIHQQRQGRFPKTIDELTALPGIGRSTAGAILSFAYHLPTPILDGNVKRVLARHFAIAGWYGQSAVSEQLWQASIAHTPKTNTHEYNQAMMDLGATCCTRTRPNCNACPLHNTCNAFQTNRTSEFPGKKPKKRKPTKQTTLLIFMNDNKIWLEKRPSKGIWGGLYSFPECPADNDLLSWCQQKFNITPTEHHPFLALTHQFTHFTLEISSYTIPIALKFDHGQFGQNGLWHYLEDTLPGGIAAPVNRLITHLQAACIDT